MEFKLPDRSQAGQMSMFALRILLGWMMLWPFFDKILGLGYQTPAGMGWIDGVSPSSFVTWFTSGVFSGFFTSVAGNPVVDVLMVAGCLGLGLTLILGFASRLTTILMCVFLAMMYCITVPPVDNPVTDYHIICIAAMLVVYFHGGFDVWSVNSRWKELGIVKRFPILA
ncbi:MAG: hypothetical protein MJZ38_06340 [archaeon]|nr:hypothetical protein [archaeon]